MTLWKVKFRRLWNNMEDTIEDKQFTARNFEQVSAGVQKYIDGLKYRTLEVIEIKECGDVEIIGD